MIEGTSGVLAKLRLMWQIKNAQLPVVEVPIQLQSGENCHFSMPVDLYETRRAYTRITSSGPMFRTKILKGIYWNTRVYDVSAKGKDVLTKVDSGPLYLTNRRVMFLGTTKSITIKLKNIVDLTPYSDGVGIDKGTGKKAVFCFTQNIDIFCAILARATHDIND
jgi:hypothetical protein